MATALNFIGDALSQPLVIALLGAALGVLLTHRFATSRARQDHQRDLERLVLEDQRRAAHDALNAVRAIRMQVAGGFTQWGLLHNEWNDAVYPATQLVHDPEFTRRVSAGLYTVFLGTITHDQHVSYAALRGALDVEEWLEAWLVRQPAPSAHLPPMDEMRKMVLVRNRITLDALNDHLAFVA